MVDERSEEERNAAMEHLRAIRAEHGLSRRPRSGASEVDAETHGEDVTRPSWDDADLEDPMAIKYALELAAHRETTDRLLAEKDRTIATLGELIAELRVQLASSDEDLVT